MYSILIDERPTKAPTGAIAVFLGLTLQFLSLPFVAHGHVVTQEQQPQPLGSLSTVGEVYVNDSRAPAESTIFVGDKVRTGENAVASFTASGKGTFKISPHSLLVFAGTGQYVAELKSGTVVTSSFSGPSGFTLRAGDFVVVPAVQEQQTTATVERLRDGSFSLSCLEGSVSVISLQGASGLFLQAGQSVTISLTGQLISNPAPSEPTQPQPRVPTPTPTPAGARRGSHKGWIILGLAGAGAAGIAAAAAAAGGGGHPPVSPSSP